MTVAIADIRFDYHDYDARGDTLFLSVAKPSGQPPEHAYETPEGHVVECDERGTIVSIELLNARWLFKRDGELRVTLAEHRAIADSHDLEAALA